MLKILIKFSPIILLFYVSLSSLNSLVFFDLFSFNFSFIIIYYWVLRDPQILGYGFIFFAGILNDVVSGLPLGLSAATFLIISSTAAYIRNLTVRRSLLLDWITFSISVLIANGIYIITIGILTDLSVDYLNLLISSIATMFIYIIGWCVFEIFNNFIFLNKHER